MTENFIAKEIVDAAFPIHTTLGPGLLESVYDSVLAYELDRRGLRAICQQPIPVVYEDVHIATGFRADMIVEDKVIVEIKSVENLALVHKKQLLTYLRLSEKRLGLLINFNVSLIKDGVTRRIKIMLGVFASWRELKNFTQSREDAKRIYLPLTRFSSDLS